MSALLETANLSKTFPVGKGKSWLARGRVQSRLHAVREVSFAILRGEAVGLVGESGCGKSTLVRILARLLDPSAGSIRFEGAEIAGIPARRFGRTPARARIQMVFQDADGSLNPRFTALDAIADPLRRLKGLKGAALKAKAAEAAALAGLPFELLGRFPHQLSGGQKARVGIARAVAVEPALLILDEPTSALDVSVQVVILNLLAELKRRLGLSFLFVSHDLNVVRLLCDRMIVMYMGEIAESGPAAEVFAAPAHPYTRALISAIPSMNVETQRARIRLAGEPRSPIDPEPNVCAFFGRCPKGEEETCARVKPALAAVGAGRLAACHFPDISAPAAEHAPPRPARAGLA